MAANEIASIACDIVRMVRYTGLSTRSRRWETDGMDGEAVQTLGKGDSAWQARAIKFDTAENLTTWFALLEDLVGSAAAITIETEVRAFDNLHVATGGERQERPVIHNDTAKFRGQIDLAGFIEVS